MPTYFFVCDACNTTYQRIVPVARRNRTVRCLKCNGITYRPIATEQRLASVGHHAGNWPMKSDAMGVHPSQINEAVDKSRAAGVPIEFTADGSAIFTSARHRKRYCERFGYYDRNAGYSDPLSKSNLRERLQRGKVDART